MPEINLPLKISKQFIILFLIIWLASSMIISLMSFSGYLKLFLILLVAGYGLKIFWQQGLLKNKHAIVGLLHDANGWKIQLRDEVFSAELMGDSTVSRVVSVLRFKVEERYQHSCVVWNDSLTTDGYRQLRVRARWASQP